MKNIILILTLIAISKFCFSQIGDSVVTNLNIRSSVVKVMASVMELTEINQLNALIKYTADYRDGSIPIDNANINIDTIYTSVLISVYEKLRNNVFTQTAFNNLATDITSKRATNTILDAGCDAIDAAFVAQQDVFIEVGRKKLVGK